MNKYLIYTTEGQAYDPHGIPVENCQVLGRIEANDKCEAISKFFQFNEWIKKTQFSEEGTYAVRLHENETV